MKNLKKLMAYSLFLLSIMFFTSCVVSARRPAPPVARVEVIPVAPSPRHVWVPGNYKWRRNKYVWHEGHYHRRH